MGICSVKPPSASQTATVQRRRWRSILRTRDSWPRRGTALHTEDAVFDDRHAVAQHVALVHRAGEPLLSLARQRRVRMAVGAHDARGEAQTRKRFIEGGDVARRHEEVLAVHLDGLERPDAIALEPALLEHHEGIVEQVGIYHLAHLVADGLLAPLGHMHQVPAQLAARRPSAAGQAHRHARCRLPRAMRCERCHFPDPFRTFGSDRSSADQTRARASSNVDQKVHVLGRRLRGMSLATIGKRNWFRSCITEILHCEEAVFYGSPLEGCV